MRSELIVNFPAWGPTTVRAGLTAVGMKLVTHSLFYGGCSAIQFACLQALTQRSIRPAFRRRLSLIVSSLAVCFEPVAALRDLFPEKYKTR